jgi:hypothetical protein
VVDLTGRHRRRPDFRRRSRSGQASRSRSRPPGARLSCRSTENTNPGLTLPWWCLVKIHAEFQGEIKTVAWQADQRADPDLIKRPKSGASRLWPCSCQADRCGWTGDQRLRCLRGCVAAWLEGAGVAGCPCVIVTAKSPTISAVGYLIHGRAARRRRH